MKKRIVRFCCFVLFPLFVSQQILFAQSTPLFPVPDSVPEKPFEQTENSAFTENPVPETSTGFLAQEISPLSLPADAVQQVQSVPRPLAVSVYPNEYYEPTHELITVYGEDRAPVFTMLLPYQTVDRVDAFEDYLIVDRSIQNTDGGARIEIYHHYIENSSAPAVILPEVAITDVYRLDNGDLVIRGTAVDQMGDYTTTVSQGQIVSRVYKPFEIFDVAGSYPSPLTMIPLVNYASDYLYAITAQPRGIAYEKMASIDSQTINFLNFNTPLIDEGVGIFLDGEKFSPQTVPVIKLAASGTSGLLRIELVSTKDVDGPAQREVKDSVLLRVRPDMQNFEIPINSFDGIDFSRQIPSFLFAMNPVDEASTYTLQVGRPGSVKINGYAAHSATSQRLVTLTIDPPAYNGGRILLMSYAVDSWEEAAFSPWESIEQQKQIELPDIQGDHYVNVRFRDEYGVVTSAWNFICYDSMAPAGTVALNGGAVYTNSRDIALDIQISDTGSGIQNWDGAFPVYYAIDSILPTHFSWLWYQPGKVIKLPESDGTHHVYVKVKDAAGNEVLVSSYIVLDRTAPTASVAIDGGASLTNRREVTLNLTATDEGAGLGKMRFTTDTVNWTWSDWEDYQPSKTFTLPPGDGTKRVYCQIYDQAWNLTTAYDDILLDTAAPSASMVINGGAATTDHLQVTLNLTANDTVSGLGKMRFTTDTVNWTWSEWEDFKSIKTLTLPVGAGNRRVYWQIYDEVWNLNTVYDDIQVVDLTPPEASMTINGGAVTTEQLEVTLNLTARDSVAGLGKMRFTTDTVNGTWSAWEDFKSTKTIVLPAGLGNKRVYWQIFDQAWNLRTLYDEIDLVDTTPPAVWIAINGGAPVTSQLQVTLNLAASDPVAGLGKMRFTVDTVNWTWSEWEDFSATKTLTLPAGDGNKRVYVQIYDQAWNLTTVYDDILYVSALPAIPDNWTRATSNPYFAFDSYFAYDPYYHSMVWQVFKTWSTSLGTFYNRKGETFAIGGGGPQDYVTGIRDVSPDGTALVYGLYYHGANYAQVRRVQDTNQVLQIALSASLQSIVFETNNLARLTAQDGTGPAYCYTVNLTNLTLVQSYQCG